VPSERHLRDGKLRGLIAAIALAGCAEEEPASSGGPAAQAGLSLVIAPVDVGTSCPPEHTLSLGDPPPSLASPGGRVPDGDGVDVACSVAYGPPFAVSAAIARGQSSLSATGSAPEGGAGTATLRLRTPELGIELETPSAVPCSVRVDSGSLDVSPGRLWAALDCPELAAGATVCRASGVIVLENCAETAVE
jgi:hypothetical protein